MNVKLKKVFNLIVFFFGLSIILLNFFPRLETIAFRAYFAMGMIFLRFLLKLAKDEEKNIFDYILSLGSLIVFSYIIYFYPSIVKSGGILSKIDFFFGFLAVALIILAGFKSSKKLLILVFIFILYAFFGKYMPMALSHSGFSLERLINHTVWGSQGIFGITIGVCASYIFLFIIFGEFLNKSGLSAFINDLSLALIGHKPGGPAKVSIIASALLGMINGSAVANVATTGMITIPLMKKTGYKGEFAAAVEASASTGGQFCPPIMGAVGFVMAEYLAISYSRVMLAAIIPALFFYFGLLVAVHQRAKLRNLKGLDREDLPKVNEVLRERGYLSLPIILVVVLIVLGYSPIYAAMFAILATILVSQFNKDDKIGPKEFFEVIVKATKGTVNISISCLLIGIIIGIVSLTALGLNFGNLIMSISAFNNLLLAGILTMIMSTILGMGIPGVAAYVIVSSVAAPILINMGALPIVAHMFCLIYACLSNITPPVAISSYVAAGISGSDEFRTSIEAVKISLTGFIFPFFFLLNPELLLGAVDFSLLSFLRIFISGIFGVFNIACASQRYLVNRLSRIESIILFVLGLLLVDPETYTDLVALGVFIIILLKNRREERVYEKI